MTDTIETLRARVAELTRERDELEHNKGDWTGKKCKTCLGTGQHIEEIERTCPDCAGTGEEWMTWRKRAEEAESALARTQDRGQGDGWRWPQAATGGWTIDPKFIAAAQAQASKKWPDVDGASLEAVEAILLVAAELFNAPPPCATVPAAAQCLGESFSYATQKGGDAKCHPVTTPCNPVAGEGATSGDDRGATVPAGGADDNTDAAFVEKMAGPEDLRHVLPLAMALGGEAADRLIKLARLGARTTAQEGVSEAEITAALDGYNHFAVDSRKDMRAALEAAARVREAGR